MSCMVSFIWNQPASSYDILWVVGVVEATEGVSTGAVLFPLLLYGFLVRDAGALQGG